MSHGDRMALPSWTAPFINRVYPDKEKITRRTLHEEAVSPEQVVRILNKAGIGAKNSDLFRKYGVSEQTFHNLRTQCGDMSIGDVRKGSRATLNGGLRRSFSTAC